MTEHDRETVKRRAAAPGQEQSASREPAYIREGRRRRKTARRIIPFLILLVFGFVIAREEIPLVYEWSEKTFRPAVWSAKKTCQQAALGQAENRQYVRILKPGRLHKTQDGQYIDRLVLGEMGASGAEEMIEYSCYLDAQGKLYKLNRISPRD